MKILVLLGLISFSLSASAQIFCHTNEGVSDCLEVSLDEDSGEITLYVSPLCDDPNCEEYEEIIYPNETFSISELLDITVTVKNGIVEQIKVSNFHDNDCCHWESGVYVFEL